MAIDSDGSVYLTDTFGGRILRLDASQIDEDGAEPEGWFQSDDFAAVGDPPFGINGIAFLDGELYVSNFNQGTLVHVSRTAEGTPEASTPLVLVDDEGSSTTLLGPDGILASTDGRMLVVESGIFTPGKSNRLSAVEIDGKNGVLNIVAEGFDVPSTVAEGPDYRWVVEGQLDHWIGLDRSEPSAFKVTGLPR